MSTRITTLLSIGVALMALLLALGLNPVTPEARAQAPGQAPSAKATPTINKKINADRLDNLHAKAFAAASHTHYGANWSGAATRGLSVATSDNNLDSAALYGSQGGGSTFVGLSAAGVRGDSSGGFGVVGTSDTGSGVFGTSNKNSGVFGQSNSEYGIYGYSVSGVGVFGSSASGTAMYALGHTAQERTAGGWVKAALLMSYNAITRCYNSQATGSAVSTPPCGFALTKWTGGDYTVDFGFRVDDRFISVTPYYGGAYFAISAVITDFPTTNRVHIREYRGNDTLVDSAFFIVVY